MGLWRPSPLPWRSTFVPWVRGGGGPLPLLLRAPPALLGAETLGLLPRHAQRDPDLRFGAQAHLRGVGVWSGQGPFPHAWGNPGLEPPSPPEQVCGWGPTLLSEASGSFSSSDTGCCASGLLSSEGRRVWVRPGWWPGGLAEAQASLAGQARTSDNNAAGEEAEAQRGRVTCPRAD